MKEAISIDWIKNYIDTLIEYAVKCPEGKMKDAALMRADHAGDLVRAWKDFGGGAYVLQSPKRNDPNARNE